MAIIKKATTTEGKILINDVSFLGFTSSLRGKIVYSKKTYKEVPKYILFWSGLSIDQIRVRFEVRNRPD
jgi:hypothetical protein